ncbi:OsmC family protein [Halalkalirubrum salinum]|uniref:OsmC family protein n=1 Tax=Halalkalirubrum salinum TaxID=2563889 RepID=UPI0010FAE786|nr:OsmC family protein [Halalkalirubrum salinum]
MSESDNRHQFSVSAIGNTETKATVSVRDFEFVIDEPATLGGTNEGPNPVEYLLGAWAGCMNVVAQKVCKEHGVKLDGLNIEVEGDLDPRKFLGMAEEPRAGFQEIRVELAAETDVDEEMLETIVEEVEARCPVGDNIIDPTPTDVTITAV